MMGFSDSKDWVDFMDLFFYYWYLNLIHHFFLFSSFHYQILMGFVWSFDYLQLYYFEAVIIILTSNLSIIFVLYLLLIILFVPLIYYFIQLKLLHDYPFVSFNHILFISYDLYFIYEPLLDVQIYRFAFNFIFSFFELPDLIL